MTKCDRFIHPAIVSFRILSQQSQNPNIAGSIEITKNNFEMSTAAFAPHQAAALEYTNWCFVLTKAENIFVIVVFIVSDQFTNGHVSFSIT
jgi:hypothetical protein